MNKQLLKKFYACLPLGMAFIVTGLMFSVSANAQIVYTDVNPDSTMYCVGTSTLNYNLDLNNDASNDFILTAYSYHPPQLGLDKNKSVTVDPLNGNAVKDTLVDSVNVSIPLQFYAVIDSNLLLNQFWPTSGTHILKYEYYGSAFSSTLGLWDSLSDYYLGLRLLQSGQTYYGWVRLRVDVTFYYASLIVKDYAYNSIPNQPILAGQTTTTGISENSFASSINLFPNPAKDLLYIDLASSNKNVEVTIADITGKVIYSTTASDPDSYQEQKLEVNTSDFAAGMYVVQIQTADFIATKKLVVER